ncbi:putative signal transducing protein [Marivirga sericea]|nr:DUF2007 domain-containing protein [Marivirga sericea]
MDQFITIATFQYPHEAHIIQSKLEAADIKVFLKDELTVQSHNFLSNAVGGIKLQVRAADVPLAVALLREMGVNVEPQEESGGYYNWIDAKTNKIPILKHWAVELRAIFIIAFILISIVVIGGIIISIAQAPTEAEKQQMAQQREEERMEHLLYDYHYPKVDSLLESNPQQAINYSKRLLRTDYPKNAQLYSDIGYGYIALDSFDLAIRYMKASKSYGYSREDRSSAIAYCHIQLKEYEEAIELYKERASSNYKAYLAVSDVYLLQKDYKNAAKYLTTYLEKREDAYLLAYTEKDFQLLKLKRDSIKSLIKE